MRKSQKTLLKNTIQIIDANNQENMEKNDPPSPSFPK
jgi:hypothetical protein